MSHQVEAVEVLPLFAALKRPFHIATSRLERVENICIAITLDSGATGLGEIATLHPVTADRYESAFEAAESLSDWLSDQVFEDWTLLTRALRTQEAARPAIAAGFEMAIIDALSIDAEKPLHAFLGQAHAPVTTDMTIPICPPETCRLLASQYFSEGFDTLKIKVGINLKHDLAALHALKKGHPTCRIIADANGGFSLHEAHEFLDAIDKNQLHIDLFEQPIPEHDLQGMHQLTQRGDTLIAADESCKSPDDAKKLIEQEAAHVLNIKLAKSGVLGGIAIHQLAQEAQLGLMIGGMVETRIGMGFAAHFTSALGGFDWIDLDTPQLLAEDPVVGGTKCVGPRWALDNTMRGHGGRIQSLESF